MAAAAAIVRLAAAAAAARRVDGWVGSLASAPVVRPPSCLPGRPLVAPLLGRSSSRTRAAGEREARGGTRPSARPPPPRDGTGRDGARLRGPADGPTLLSGSPSSLPPSRRSLSSCCLPPLPRASAAGRRAGGRARRCGGGRGRGRGGARRAEAGFPPPRRSFARRRRRRPAPDDPDPSVVPPSSLRELHGYPRTPLAALLSPDFHRTVGCRY